MTDFEFMEEREIAELERWRDERGLPVLPDAPGRAHPRFIGDIEVMLDELLPEEGAELMRTRSPAAGTC